MAAHTTPGGFYASLSGHEFQIRLLHLQPSFHRNTRIECRLEQTSLDSETKYEALSYVWGPPGNEYTISVDNRETWVRPNLFNALQELRSKFSVRTLWIDALCINQNDDTERNHQVSGVGDIYRRASRVVAGSE